MYVDLTPLPTPYTHSLVRSFMVLLLKILVRTGMGKLG